MPSEHNPGEPEFGEYSGEAEHNPGEPEFAEGGAEEGAGAGGADYSSADPSDPGPELDDDDA